MDILDPIKQGWPVIEAAPLPVIGLMVAAAIAAWWFRGQIGKGRTEALEERLRLAGDKIVIADDAKKERDEKIAELQRQIEAKAANNVLTATSSTVTASAAAFDAAWNEVETTIVPGMAIKHGAAARALVSRAPPPPKTIVNPNPRPPKSKN